MNREVPFDDDAICDICGHKGAFDFMGDYICESCASENLPQEDYTEDR